MAEDFAPFDVDITTERPSVFNSSTLHCLITRSIQVDNVTPMPQAQAGGVAYLYAYKDIYWARKQPCLVYFDNLGNRAVRRRLRPAVPYST